MRNFSRSGPVLRTIFWLAVSALLLYLALRDVRPAEVGAALRQADAGWLALALASVAGNVLFKSLRWQVMLAHSPRQVGLGRLVAALLAGQTLNWFLPGRVGDVSRIMTVGGMGPGRTYTLTSLALEKLLDTVCYVLIFGWVILLGGQRALALPGWVSESGYTLIGLATVMLLAAAWMTARPAGFLRLAERLATWLPLRVRQWSLARLRSGLDGLAALRSGGDVARLAGWSAATWAAAVLTNHLVGLALRLDLPVSAAMVVLVFLQVGISLPGTPGRIGIFQYLCILALGIFGVGEAAGFSYGIILQAVVLLPTTLVSLALMGWLQVNLAEIRAMPDAHMRE